MSQHTLTIFFIDGEYIARFLKDYPEDFWIIYSEC